MNLQDIKLRKVKRQVEGYSSQLKDIVQQDLPKKADKTYTDNQLLLKRDKAVKLVMEDMSETVISAMTGGATVSVMSIPQDGSVTEQKTDSSVLINPFINLFKTAKNMTPSVNGATKVDEADGSYTVTSTTNYGTINGRINQLTPQRKYIGLVKVKSDTLTSISTVINAYQSDGTYQSQLKNEIQTISNAYKILKTSIFTTPALNGRIYFGVTTTSTTGIYNVRDYILLDVTGIDDAIINNINWELNFDKILNSASNRIPFLTENANKAKTADYANDGAFLKPVSVYRNLSGDFNLIDSRRANLAIGSYGFANGIASGTPATDYSAIRFLNPATVGKKYLFTAMAKADSPTSVAMSAYEYNGSTSIPSSYKQGAIVNIDTNWKRVSGEFTITDSTATQVASGIIYKGTTPYVKIYMKELMMIEVTNEFLPDYAIDGLGSYWIDYPSDVSSKVKYAVKSAKSDYAGTSDYAIKVENKWKGKTWITLGDSITANNGYQPLVNNVLEFGSVVNKGVGGQSVATMTDNITQAEAQLAHLITLYGCLNDFYVGAAPIGNITDAPSKTGATFISKLKYVIEQVFTLNPTARLVIIGTHNATDASRPPLYGVINGSDGIGEYVKAMGNVARYYGCPFIDMYGKSGFNAFNLSTYTGDGIHPNATGYKEIARVLIGEIKAIEPIS